MPRGKVKFFDATKRYGFIAPADGGDDLFMHASAVEDAGMDTLRTDDLVSYEVGVNTRNQRPKAVQLRLLARVNYADLLNLLGRSGQCPLVSPTADISTPGLGADIVAKVVLR